MFEVFFVLNIQLFDDLVVMLFGEIIEAIFDDLNRKLYIGCLVYFTFQAAAERHS